MRVGCGSGTRQGGRVPKARRFQALASTIGESNSQDVPDGMEATKQAGSNRGGSGYISLSRGFDAIDTRRRPQKRLVGVVGFEPTTWPHPTL